MPIDRNRLQPTRTLRASSPPRAVDIETAPALELPTPEAQEIPRAAPASPTGSSQWFIAGEDYATIDSRWSELSEQVSMHPEFVTMGLNGVGATRAPPRESLRRRDGRPQPRSTNPPVVGHDGSTMYINSENESIEGQQRLAIHGGGIGQETYYDTHRLSTTQMAREFRGNGFVVTDQMTRFKMRGQDSVFQLLGGSGYDNSYLEVLVSSDRGTHRIKPIILIARKNELTLVRKIIRQETRTELITHGIRIVNRLEAKTIGRVVELDESKFSR